MAAVVYVDGLAGSLYLERERGVQRFSEALAQLHAVSLSLRDSLDLLTSFIELTNQNSSTAEPMGVRLI